MIVNAPVLAQGGPARVFVLKDWFKITIQVVSAFTVFLGTNKQEAGELNNGQTFDGLQFNQNNALVPVQIWWKGELWISGSDPGAFCVLIIPGLTPAIHEAGGGDQCVSQPGE